MMASTKGLQKGLNSARGMLGGFAKSVTGLQGLITGAFAGTGLAALQHFAGLADDLSDNIERLETMFGSASSSIVAQAEKMNAAFGTSEITFTEMATKMGGLFKSMGVAEGPAAEMTNQLLVMGQAIANFKGISLEQAMGKIQAGMAGKGKGLKEFGISVSASMTAQERFNAIMAGGAGILGTMDQRAMDAGASWASFRGRVEEIEIAIGKNLPEMVEPFFAELNVLVVAAGDAFKSLKQTTLDWGQGSIEASKSAVEGMGWVQKSVGFLADSWQLVSAGFHAFRASFTEGLGMLIGTISKIGKGIDWLFEKLGLVDKVQSDTGIGAFLDNWAEGLHDAASKEFDDLKKDWAKPWSSEGIDAAFAASKKKIDDARKNVVKGALGAVAPKSAAETKSVAKSAGEAMTIGSAAAASAFIRSRFEIGGNDDTKKIAKNSDEQVKLLGDIKSNLEAGNGAEMMDDFN